MLMSGLSFFSNEKASKNEFPAKKTGCLIIDNP